jgi:hypothetical protein
MAVSIMGQELGVEVCAKILIDVLNFPRQLDDNISVLRT